MNSLRLRIRPLTQGVLHPRQPARITTSAPLQTRLYATTDSMPRLAQSSFWNMIIPKFVRNSLSRDPQVRAAARSKGWNPATFYITMFVLIGSQAIRMLTLKNDFGNYTRSTNARIGLLKDVIEKVQRGEEVDVEKLLGTGDEPREREWDEVLRELEKEDAVWAEEAGKKKKAAADESADKDPAIPAEGKGNQNPPPGSAPARKLNFF